MKHLKEFNNYEQNEGIKNFMVGALLFLASCTSYTVKDNQGNKLHKPVEKTIKGYVVKETWVPSKSNYAQWMTIKGNDGNVYRYVINNTMLTSKSWKINDGDSVRMVFDENGDAQVYKLEEK